MLGGERHDAVHVCRMAEDVDDHDRFRVQS
jgi:hypothetical protein